MAGCGCYCHPKDSSTPKERFSRSEASLPYPYICARCHAWRCCLSCWDCWQTYPIPNWWDKDYQGKWLYFKQTYPASFCCVDDSVALPYQVVYVISCTSCRFSWIPRQRMTLSTSWRRLRESTGSSPGKMLFLSTQLLRLKFCFSEELSSHASGFI